MTPWNRFISQYKKDLKLWLFAMVVLSAFRCAFVVIFRAKITEGTGADIFQALLNGMRFDAMSAAYWTFFPFLLSAASAVADIRSIADRVRNAFAVGFSVVTPLLFIITIVYFHEYNDNFNHFIFNLYYDDTGAIFSTIWAGYHPIRNLLIIGALIALLLFLKQRWQRSDFLTHDANRRAPASVIVRIVIALICFVLFIGALRGSFGHRPLKLEDAGVTRDGFLNKAVINPYSAIWYAYVARQRLSASSKGLSFFLPDGDIRKALEETYGRKNGAVTIDSYLEKTASGPAGVAPRHIFLVVMESYDAWPLMQKYASLGLSTELARLGREGISVERFLPSSDGTATSLAVIVTGLADAGVVTNYRPSSEKPYPTTLASQFSRMGYRARFFYGGYLTWQKIGDFMKAQGFEEIYGGGHVDSAGASKTEWGVEDDALFAFAATTVAGQKDQPSFNLILTTSYHPPYDLDVRKRGFTLKDIPADLAPLYDGSTTLTMLGHLWYSDQCIGSFVRKTEKQLPRALFAFTGDHFSRKYLNIHPEAYEGAAVPFILYGKEVLKGIRPSRQAAGSHLDIGPTLIELTAPRGFQYTAQGENILGPHAGPFGISRDWVIGSDFLFNANDRRFFPLPGKELPANLPDPAALKATRDRLHGIAWWRIMRGPGL